MGLAWIPAAAPEGDTLLAVFGEPNRFDPEAGTWVPLCGIGPCTGEDLLVTSTGALVLGALFGPTDLDRSTDGGRTWRKDVGLGLSPRVLFEADLPAFRGRFGGPVLFALEGPESWRSAGDGAWGTWTTRRSTLGEGRAIAELPPSDSIPTGRLLVGVYNGVVGSTDAGESWEPTGLYAQGGYIASALSVAPDPAHPYGGVVYASGAAFAPRRGFVARSDDGDATWTEVLSAEDGAYGLAYPIYARALAVDASPVAGEGAVEVWASVAGRPPDPGVLLRSRDGGATWERAEGTGGYDGEKPEEMALDRTGRLYLATRRGLWRTAEPVGRPWAVTASAPRAPEASGAELTVAPNPSNGGAEARLVLASPEASVRVAVFDARGREVAVLASGARGRGDHRLAVPSGLAPGVYVVRLSAGESAPISQRFTIAR